MPTAWLPCPGKVNAMAMLRGPRFRCATACGARRAAKSRAAARSPELPHACQNAHAKNFTPASQFPPQGLAFCDGTMTGSMTVLTTHRGLELAKQNAAISPAAEDAAAGAGSAGASGGRSNAPDRLRLRSLLSAHPRLPDRTDRARLAAADARLLPAAFPARLDDGRSFSRCCWSVSTRCSGAATTASCSSRRSRCCSPPSATRSRSISAIRSIRPTSSIRARSWN